MRIVNSLLLIPHLKLWDKKCGKWIRFILWPVQVLYIKLLQTCRYIISLKKRQVGFSQLTGADSLIQCMSLENFAVLLLSVTGDDAAVFLGRIRGMHQQIPSPEDIVTRRQAGEQIPEGLEILVALKAANPVIKGADAGEEMVFVSGSSIVSLSAHRGRGRTADRVVLDEAAFYTTKDAKITLEEVMMSIGPALDRSDGQLIIISTANGLNTYHKYYQEAKKRLSKFCHFFVSCYDDPEFTPAKRADIVTTHGKDHANQEYPRNDAEAFLSSGRPRFDLEKLNAYRKIEPIWTGELDYTSDSLLKADKGPLKLYKRRDPLGSYAVIADVAEGLDIGDYSCAKVFDRRTGEQVAEWHGHIEHALFGSVVASLGRIFINAVLVVEANNHGASTITQIRNVEEYPERLIFEHDVVAKEKADDDFKSPEKRYGWRTTTATRPTIINNLAKMILAGDIPGLSEDDIGELMTFVIKKGKAQAEDNCYDDRVMTLAIAYYLLTNDTFNMFYAIAQPAGIWERCDSCHWCKKQDKYSTVGVCELSRRATKDDQFCALNEAIRYPLDAELSKPGRKYIPLAKK